MITLSADAAYGYGGKQYVARVTGRDPKWGLKLQFLGSKFGKRDEGTSADVDEPGVYVTRDVDRKGAKDDTYRVVLPDPNDPDDVVKSTPIDKADAMKIAKRLDAGESIERIVELTARPSQRDPSVTLYDAAIVTARQAETKQAAQTIDAAVEACWAAIQALPEARARKVLAQLKLRVSPPKQAVRAAQTAVGPAADVPVGVIADAAQDAGVTQQALGLTPTPVKADDHA